ncbi:plasmid maintenance system antidote protein VapI [Labrenzia sp. EL_126]|nr:plasmid maintenance system antidote protein VapI [Labrenzia sp. EL_126]
MAEVISIKPASVWPLASFLADEMTARDWTCIDVAQRMPGNYGRNLVLINLLMAVQQDKMFICEETFSDLSEAFGISAGFFKKLHSQWERWPDAREPFECPEHLLGGLIFPSNENRSKIKQDS